MEIRLDGFSFQYVSSQPTVVSEVSVAVASGACCAILGPTGAGKTTLLLAISGALGAQHSSGTGRGEISVGPHVFRPMPDKVLFPQVGLCLQEPQIMISGLRDTVYDEIKFSLENISVDPELHEEQIVSVMERLGIQHLRDRKPFTLSGGELQRLTLATLLVVQPPVLLLDEPGNSLDDDALSRLVRILRQLRGRTTVLFSDNQPDLAILAADSILIMEDGEVISFGDKKSFLKNLGEFKSSLPVRKWQDVIRVLSRSSSLRAKRVKKRFGLA
ncbi:MAG: ABC transporter ATP-binding protein [Ignavibacteriales bacterium]|nr:ABC transporter ATP-binding protein [Ignavibacteriales bacterium]